MNTRAFLQQLETAKGLEVLLVLGGEGPDLSRTRHAFDVAVGLDLRYHREIENVSNDPMMFVLSGGYSGLNDVPPSRTDTDPMRDFLLYCGIPRHHIFEENDSRDTLSGMYFSRPIIGDLLSGKIVKAFGLVTDQFHMDRSLWIARKVFSEKYRVVPLPTDRHVGVTQNLIEKMVKMAWAFDLWRADVEDGNMEDFKRYMTTHPFYHANVPMSAYKLGIIGLKMLGTPKDYRKK